MIRGMRQSGRMPRRAALPDELGDSFRVADARARGVGEQRLTAADLESLFHGARIAVRGDLGISRSSPAWRREQDDLARRLAAYRPVMPGGAFFAGVTAARLWDLPLPPGVHRTLRVGVLHPRTAPSRAGVRGVQVLPRMARIVRRGGDLVTDPATTWAMLGGDLGRNDLVAVADAVLRIPRRPGGFGFGVEPALGTRDELVAALAAGRRRGAAALREALELARTGSSSRPESWVRMILVDAGLPEPVLDLDVYDDETHRFLGAVDLAYPAWRVAIEYEGAGHLEPGQLARDIDKYHDLHRAGWTVIRLTSDLVFRHPEEAVRRIRRALLSA